MIRAPRADVLLALANPGRPVHEHSPLAAVSTICSWFVLDPLDILPDVGVGVSHHAASSE
jgi:hypothetical protein